MINNMPLLTNTENPVPRMVNLKEAASITGLSEHFIRQLCIDNKISHVKPGNRYLVNLDRFIDYLNAPPISPTPKINGVRRIQE